MYVASQTIQFISGNFNETDQNNFSKLYTKMAFSTLFSTLGCFFTILGKLFLLYRANNKKVVDIKVMEPNHSTDNVDKCNITHTADNMIYQTSDSSNKIQFDSKSNKIKSDLWVWKRFAITLAATNFVSIGIITIIFITGEYLKQILNIDSQVLSLFTIYHYLLIIPIVTIITWVFIFTLEIMLKMDILITWFLERENYFKDIIFIIGIHN